MRWKEMRKRRFISFILLLSKSFHSIKSHIFLLSLFLASVFVWWEKYFIKSTTYRIKRNGVWGIFYWSTLLPWWFIKFYFNGKYQSSNFMLVLTFHFIFVVFVRVKRKRKIKTKYSSKVDPNQTHKRLRDHTNKE